MPSTIACFAHVIAVSTILPLTGCEREESVTPPVSPPSTVSHERPQQPSEPEPPTDERETPKDETATASTVAPLSETDKIERLLAIIGGLRNAAFVRNGSDHTPAEAVDHLRRKLAADETSRSSAAQFIERLATKSSLTGELYQIRFEDGSTQPAGEFLSKQLAEVVALEE